MKRIYKSIVMQTFTYIHNYKYINLLDIFQNVQFYYIYRHMYLLLLSTLINIFHYYYYNLYFIWLYSKIELPMYSKLFVCVSFMCIIRQFL